MKRFGIALLAVLVALFMQTGLLYAQGLYFETYRSGDSVPSAKVSYMPGMAKIVTKSGRIILLRVDKGYVDILNPARKMYNQISFDDLKNNRFAKLTPDERSMFQQRANRSRTKANSSLDAIQTGETKTIEGFKCSQFVVKDSGQVVQTVWATKDVKGVDSLQRDADELLTHLGTSTVMTQTLARWIDIVGGLPIQIEGHGVTTNIRNIQQESIPESEFRVPAGYTNMSHVRQGGHD